MISAAVVMDDMRRRNPEIPSLMRAVWALTALYSGPIGVGLYWATGRKQIARDSLWRRAGRSVAHCYSGCGAGEIVGLILAVGVLALGAGWAAAVTFSFAYLFGMALTVGPLMQEGVGLPQALIDAFWSETASIAVMEAVAISVDLWLAGDAGMAEPLFWSALAVSLTLGLAAAYPVNALLIAFGVKEGMHDPREMAKS
ncbi:MAG: DUF4396 domain-containing protein [Marivibrio sp.]|uniref:DUF4396 domain-containing protein n=1 Tax=Marivibrio sp. TaxID=2039719 RepID=UPI0032EE3E23